MPASSWSRFWNSASIFFCARTAGTASRRMRSVFTKPILLSAWAWLAFAATRSGSTAMSCTIFKSVSRLLAIPAR